MARTRFRIQPRFYAILAAFVIVAAVAVVIITGGMDERVLTTGSVTLDYETKSVIIRDESVINVEKYDRVQYLVKEGSAVTDGTPVAIVHKWGYSDDMMQSLITVQKQVLTEQMSIIEGISNPDLETLNLQIEQKEMTIREALLGAYDGDLLVLETELKDLLTKRMELLKANVQPNETLTLLYADMDSRTAQISEWQSIVSAMGSGTISFYFDGYEQVLCANKLDTINASLVSTAIKNAAGGTSGSDQNMLYRLVNEQHWYIAFVTPLDQPFRLVSGQTYTVTFDDNTNGTHMGVALEPVINEGGVVNMIEFNESIGKLKSVRISNIRLSAQADGILAPISAIGTNDEGIPYIEINSGSGKEKIEINVLACDGENAVITAKNSGSVLGSGMRYSKP